jgi:O-Antigen ligase
VIAATLLLAGAVAAPSFTGGGFDPPSQALFIATAGAALLAAVMVDAEGAMAAARSPLALVLSSLAVLSLASALWTIESQSAALRWGLVIGGYAAVFVAASVVTRLTEYWTVAAGIALLAAIEAALGLRAIALHALPDAERIAHTWQPGGTFQYPPALAILQVGALPVLNLGMRQRPSPISVCAPAAAVLAGATLRLADSRLAIGLTALLLLALLFPRAPAPGAQAATLAMIVLVLMGAALAPRILGGNVGPATAPIGPRGTHEMLGLALAGGLAWTAGRRILANRRRTAVVTLGALAAVALALLVLLGARGGGMPSLAGPRASASIASSRSTDPLHGRAREWQAAIQTWLDRPLLGAGAEAYYIASLPHQRTARSRFAHDLPLELAAELGVPGLLLGIAVYASGAWTVAIRRGTRGYWLLAPMVSAFLVSNLIDWTWHLAGQFSRPPAARFTPSGTNYLLRVHPELEVDMCRS